MLGFDYLNPQSNINNSPYAKHVEISSFGFASSAIFAAQANGLVCKSLGRSPR